MTRNICGVWANDDDGLTHYIECVRGWYYPCCGGQALLQLDVSDIEADDFAVCLWCIVDVIGTPDWWEVDE